MTDTTSAALIGAGAVCGALLAIFGVIAVVWKIALPWLRQEIAVPVQQSNAALTVNHHTSEQPTVLDRLDDITAAVESLEAVVGQVAAKVDSVTTDVSVVDGKASRIGGQLDVHLASAVTTDASVHARLSALEGRTKEKP